MSFDVVSRFFVAWFCAGFWLIFGLLVVRVFRHAFKSNSGMFWVLFYYFHVVREKRAHAEYTVKAFFLS